MSEEQCCKNNRFTQLSELMIVHNQDRIANLGARLVNNLELVNQDSTWINGLSWMIRIKDAFLQRQLIK